MRIFAHIPNQIKIFVQNKVKEDLEGKICQLLKMMDLYKNMANYSLGRMMMAQRNMPEKPAVIHLVFQK